MPNQTVKFVATAPPAVAANVQFQVNNWTTGTDSSVEAQQLKEGNTVSFTNPGNGNNNKDIHVSFPDGNTPFEVDLSAVPPITRDFDVPKNTTAIAPITRKVKTGTKGNTYKYYATMKQAVGSDDVIADPRFIIST